MLLTLSSQSRVVDYAGLANYLSVLQAAVTIEEQKKFLFIPL
jgi:hypothetical protein